MSTPPPNQPDWRRHRRGVYLGALLIVLGLYFLLQNLGLLPPITGDIVWPLVLILIGVWFLVGRRA